MVNWKRCVGYSNAETRPVGQNEPNEMFDVQFSTFIFHRRTLTTGFSPNPPEPEAPPKNDYKGLQPFPTEFVDAFCRRRTLAPLFAEILSRKNRSASWTGRRRTKRQVTVRFNF
jgi:hypothetical protein